MGIWATRAQGLPQISIVGRFAGELQEAEEAARRLGQLACTLKAKGLGFRDSLSLKDPQIMELPAQGFRAYRAGCVSRSASPASKKGLELRGACCKRV